MKCERTSGHVKENERCVMARSTTTPIGPILAAVRAVPIPSKPMADSGPPPAKPFVTISREPGAGAVGVGRNFVETINAEVPDEEKWTCWDRELVEKVAADHHLSSRLIEGLEENNHSWMTRFLASLAFADSGHNCDEDTVYQKVKRTIEALATAGRVVIIGRGGVFITHHMPGGIHIRLVAPFEKRVQLMASQLSLSNRSAASHIRELERNRRTFFRMHWPNKSLDADLFALTINTVEVEIRSIVKMLRTLVDQKIAEPVR
jgi:cytidylate kinase